MKSNGRGYLAKAGRDIVKEKRCDMEHRVKVTVLDKSYFRNYKHKIAQTPTAGNVLVIMWAMNLCFIEMMSEMITGIWEQVLW